MKIILTSDVKGKGKTGEIIEVNNNFGRKVIIDKGLGVIATPENINNLKLQKKNNDKIESEKVTKAKQHKEILEKHEIVIGAKVGKDQKLFGSITTKEVADKITKELGIEVDKKNIIGGTLNQLGETYIKIKLHRDITAELKLIITSL